MKYKLTKYNIYITVISLVFIVGCNSKTGSEIENYVQNTENGLRFEQTSSDGVKLVIQYKPPQLLAYYENRVSKSEITQDVLKEKMKSYSTMFNFEYRIYKDILRGLSDGQAYFYKYNSDKSFYLLKNNKDTIRCLISQIEKYDAIKPYTSFNLGFEKPINEDIDITFICDDHNKVLPNEIFKISSLKLEEVEKLKLKI